MTKVVAAQMQSSRDSATELIKAFASIAHSSLAPKLPDGNAKEFLGLAISAAARCDDCIAFHVQAALKQGATREYPMVTPGMAIYMGAGPAVMHATHAQGSKREWQRRTPAVGCNARRAAACKPIRGHVT